MPDEKISALAAYTSLAGADLLAVVDVSDTTMAPSGTDKAATVSQMIGSPSAGQILYATGSPVQPAGATSILVGANGQLNLAPIATPGTQVAGDRWTDATQLCEAGFDGSATSANCVTWYRTGLLYRQNAKVTVGGTGSTSLISTASCTGSNALPANLFNVLNRAIRVKAGGYYVFNVGSSSPWLFLKLGSTIIATIKATMSLGTTSGAWSYDADIVVKAIGTGTTGKLDTTGFCFIDAGSLSVQNATAYNSPAAATQVSFDSTSAYTFDMQLNLSVAQTTGFVLSNLSLEVMG
jgi:hypothetical protein